jgi:CRP/FNR family transcriptional regulator, cyclic AMP receptor protein
VDSHESVALQADVDAVWRVALARRGYTRVYPARSIIIHEGDSGGLLYLITEGAGKIYSANESGKVIVFATFGPGDLLGEPTLDGGSRTASVMTTERTTCSVIRASDFTQMIASDPTLAMQVIFRLISLMRASNDHVRSLYGRVVRLLMKSATPEGARWIIHRKLTQQMIAEHVGSSREMVSRIMRDLEGGGYIAVGKDAITIERKPPPGW